MTKIILASGSPRRKVLFGEICPSFEVVPSQFEEEGVPKTRGDIYAMALAYLKAQAVLEDYPQALVLGADTLIYFQGEVIGKPQDREEARAILSRLSGQSHQVITGYAILTKDKKYLDYSRSIVTFKDLTDKAIEAYLDTGDYRDKAGAYGIQGQAKDLVAGYQGDLNNIIGLPLEDLKGALRNQGFIERDPGLWRV
ncbi:MAG: Maf family protein [Tissierellia bacterium]|nr:Maf family protein [Tissierellia bacterium]